MGPVWGLILGLSWTQLGPNLGPAWGLNLGPSWGLSWGQLGGPSWGRLGCRLGCRLGASSWGRLGGPSQGRLGANRGKLHRPIRSQDGLSLDMNTFASALVPLMRFALGPSAMAASLGCALCYTLSCTLGCTPGCALSLSGRRSPPKPSH